MSYMKNEEKNVQKNIKSNSLDNANKSKLELLNERKKSDPNYVKMIKVTNLFIKISGIIFALSFFGTIAFLNLNKIIRNANLIASLLFIFGLLFFILVGIICSKKIDKYEERNNLKLDSDIPNEIFKLIIEDFRNDKLNQLTNNLKVLLKNSTVKTFFEKSLIGDFIILIIRNKEHEIHIEIDNEGATISLDDEGENPIDLEVCYSSPLNKDSFYQEIISCIKEFIN